MTCSVTRLAARVLAVCALALCCASGRASEPQTLYSWDFNTQQEVDAWSPASLTKPICKDGALCAKYTSWDPFVVSPQFEFKPRPGQYIEIRMKSTGFYIGEIFYASSNEGKYNGFSQEKTANWDIVHDGKWRTYQILPAWLSEPQIIKIRVDLGRPTEEEIKNGASVEIDYIRILDINVDQTQAMTQTDWSGEELDALRCDSSVDTNGWRSELGVLDPAAVGTNLYLEYENNGQDPAGPFPRANLRFLTGVGSGVVSFEVPLFNVGAPDSKRLAKNVDLSAYKEFGAKMFRWELTTPREFDVKRVAFSKEPLGFGALETQGNGAQPELARLQQGKAAVQYEMIARNSGGAELKRLQIVAPTNGPKLELVTAQKIAVDPLLGFNPTGDRLASSGASGDLADADLHGIQTGPDGKAVFPGFFKLAPGEACRIVAHYVTEESGKFETELTLSARSEIDGQKQTSTYVFKPKLNVLPAIDVPKMDYVAPPKKLESEYEIGAYYFPGWSKRSGWDKIDDAAPIRKPLLGYYDEANPEVVDWQIKWAAENGIQFFLVDWYWKKGQIHLDHWVRAFQQAKYRSNLKWAMMWANHTGYGTHSTEDWKNVTQYWLDHYFNTPEYYTIDGKPVVVMWDASIVDHDMIEEAKQEGLDLKPGEGCKRAIKIVRDMCVEAGYPGVYFIAMKWPEHAVDPATVQKYADQGFDATTIYHFMYGGKGVKNPQLYSFDEVAAAQKPNWDERAKTGILPTIPNISTGWDSRPWHGFRSTVVYDRSVEAFRRILKDYKEYAKETGNKRVVLGPLNEWGEGSYIEPNNEFGFGMYEAIREELCKEPEGGFPVNYAPYEVGLGPYDLPKDK